MLAVSSPSSGDQCPNVADFTPSLKLGGWGEGGLMEPRAVGFPLQPGAQPSHKAQEKSRVLNCKSSPTWGMASKQPEQFLEDAEIPSTGQSS